MLAIVGYHDSMYIPAIIKNQNKRHSKICKNEKSSYALMVPFSTGHHAWISHLLTSRSHFPVKTPVVKQKREVYQTSPLIFQIHVIDKAVNIDALQKFHKKI